MCLAESAAILRCHDSLWPGTYEVTVEIQDQQGEMCPEPQKVQVDVCTCDEGRSCKISKGSELGPAAIGLIFLGLLMLLRELYLHDITYTFSIGIVNPNDL